MEEYIQKIVRDQEEAEKRNAEREIAFLNAITALATLDVHINGMPARLVGYKSVESESRYLMLCTFKTESNRFYNLSLELSSTARSAPFAGRADTAAG